MEETLQKIEGLKDLAYRAHLGTSFSPEKRAEQFVAEFKEDYQTFIADIPVEYHQGVTSKYIQLLTAWLYAKGRCISSMITGPAKFPMRRAEKANQSERNRYDEFAEWKKKVTKRLNRKERLGIDEEIIRLEHKVASLEEFQERMKAINKVVKGKKSEEEKLRLLIEDQGLPEIEAREIMSPDCMGIVGFARFMLSNNLQKLIATKERLSKLQRSAGTETTEEKINGVRVEQNARDNRVRLYFNGKPSDDVRNSLKKAGFKWAPSAGAWQNFLNPRNMNKALVIIRGISSEK